MVENGLGAKDVLTENHEIHDNYRIDYIREHIKQMHLAVDDGVDVLGYTAWGCIDLVSQSRGEMSKRYGFIYVDISDDGSGTRARYKKDSFYWYKKVIASNGEDLGDGPGQMLERIADCLIKTKRKEWCSGFHMHARHTKRQNNYRQASMKYRKPYRRQS